MCFCVDKENHYCVSDISCLDHGDRQKAVVYCFYRTFIDKSTGVIPSVILNLNYLDF